MQTTSSSGKLYITMAVMYGCLERENDKVFKFHMNNSYLFELSKRTLE